MCRLDPSAEGLPWNGRKSSAGWRRLWPPTWSGTALMAADEAGTHARLKALRKQFVEPTIAAHHGRTVKLMGDGALVEFASVVDAVHWPSRSSAPWPSASRALPVTNGFASASASTSATSSSRATTSTAMASTSRRGWKVWPSPAAS